MAASVNCVSLHGMNILAPSLFSIEKVLSLFEIHVSNLEVKETLLKDESIAFSTIRHNFRHNKLKTTAGNKFKKLQIENVC